MRHLPILICKYAAMAETHIQKGGKYEIDADAYPKFKDLLNDSFIEKDSMNQLWFITSNKEIFKKLTKKYFDKDAWDIVRLISQPMIKSNICKISGIPKSSANVMINDLINLGILVPVGVVHTPKPILTYQPFFKELYFSISTKSNIIKFNLNKELIQRILIKNKEMLQ